MGDEMKGQLPTLVRDPWCGGAELRSSDRDFLRMATAVLVADDSVTHIRQHAYIQHVRSCCSYLETPDSMSIRCYSSYGSRDPWLHPYS
jgi:hypothetical protein